MFEQDFLCAINTDTTLTNSDLNVGNDWLAAMDAAAGDANITLQFCMMNGVHALATINVQHVTNGRATRDNHPHQPQSTSVDPGNAGNGQVLGLSSMLHYALGIWPSRDNVWTNSTVVAHGGPEPMVETQTLLAVLTGGPYGPSDAAGAANRSLIMRSCRSDGLLLKADKPATMLDAALKASGFDRWANPLAINVWGAHSDVPLLASTDADGGGSSANSTSVRFGYIIGLNLVAPFNVYPHDICSRAHASPPNAFVAWEYWGGPSREGQGRSRMKAEATQTIPVTESTPLTLPATGEPKDAATIASSYYVLAPVLQNGWVFHGEPQKIVAASSRRVSWIRLLSSCTRSNQRRRRPGDADAGGADAGADENPRRGTEGNGDDGDCDGRRDGGAGIEVRVRGALDEVAIFAVQEPTIAASTAIVRHVTCAFGAAGSVKGDRVPGIQGSTSTQRGVNNRGGGIDAWADDYLMTIRCTLQGSCECVR